MNIGNIHYIERPGMGPEEQRLAVKYLALLDRIYRYRRMQQYALSVACANAAAIVKARLEAVCERRLAA